MPWANLDVLSRHVADALGVHVIGGDAGGEADGGEDGELARGIQPVHICGGVGLGVPQALGLGEDLLVAQALGSHAGEDVVGGAVHDAGDGEHGVSGQVVLEGSHDGDAAAAGRLAAQLDAGARRRPGEFGHVASEQGLVGRDNVLAMGEGLLEDFGRGMLPADDLDNDIDGGVGDDFAPIARELLVRNPERAGAPGVETAGARDAQVDPVCRPIAIGMALDQAEDAAAHGAKPDESYVHGARRLFHGCSSRPRRNGSEGWLLVIGSILPARAGRRLFHGCSSRPRRNGSEGWLLVIGSILPARAGGVWEASYTL